MIFSDRFLRVLRCRFWKNVARHVTVPRKRSNERIKLQHARRLSVGALIIVRLEGKREQMMQKSMFNKYIKWRRKAFLKWKAEQKVQNEEILLRNMRVAPVIWA